MKTKGVGTIYSKKVDYPNINDPNSRFYKHQNFNSSTSKCTKRHNLAS